MNVKAAGAGSSKAAELETVVRVAGGKVTPSAGWDDSQAGRMGGRGADAVQERMFAENQRGLRYREIRGSQALPFYAALEMTGTYRGSPLAEIRGGQNSVAISVHGDNRFRTVTIGCQRTSVVTTDANLRTQMTTVLEDGHVSVYSQEWSPERGPVGPITSLEPQSSIVKEMSQPVTDGEVTKIREQALHALDPAYRPKNC
jgi:hypothetical protein